MGLLKTFLLLTFSLGCFKTFSQSCNCPPATGCAPCVGGLTSLTLRFDGAIASTITASDQIGVVFSDLVSPGETFTLTGSIPNDKFAGPSVQLTVNGVNNTTFSSNCGGAAFIGSSSGSFTVVAASSKNGGSICCHPAVVDSQAPVISNCPTVITKLLTSACIVTVNWTPPTASDNCSVANLTSTHDPGDEFAPGTTQVTYTAADSYGNTSTCSFGVVIIDNVSPTFTACPANITIAASAMCDASVSWTEPVANDNCSISNQSQTHYPNDVFSVGTTTVTYTATDGSGNTGTCSFTVTVEDTSAPVFTECPLNITVTAGENCNSVVTWTDPLATDNCGMAGIVKSHTSGSEFEVGETGVTYTAIDIYGNSTTCTFIVTVSYTALPEVSGCPADLTETSDDSNQAIVTWREPTFTTRCGFLTVQKSHEPGDLFPVGQTEVTYTATDESGNAAECRFKITVDLPRLAIDISKLITPDGDGFNDFWKITNLENYPDNRVTIFDRWGSVLYKSSGYNNQSVVWTGTNNDNSSLPAGTYFYVLEVTYGRQKVKREGFIELVK